MNKTTLTLDIEHEDKTLHPLHRLLHNTVVTYNKENGTDYMLTASSIVEFDASSNVVYINGASEVKKGILLNPNRII